MMEKSWKMLKKYCKNDGKIMEKSWENFEIVTEKSRKVRRKIMEKSL